MSHPSIPPRHSFLLKIVAALILVAVGDRLLLHWTEEPRGFAPGLFAGAWLLALIATRPASRRHGGARIAMGVALLCAVAFIDDPSVIAFALFWAALSLAALLPRARFGHALAWVLPLLLHAVTGPFAALLDVVKLGRTRPRAGRLSLRGIATALALPLIGGLAFLALFASANPVIAEAFRPGASPDVPRLLGWGLLFVCLWPALRPRPASTRLMVADLEAAPALPEVPLASVLLSLATFNAIFALQNGLDIMFLWSGAPLPGTITLADYAHRGAYALIVSALLAGGLALWMLRPGSDTVRHPWARGMLALWVGQNLLLVASSMLRTFDYVEAFGLTRLRIAALAWMVLVGIGLAAICWRILRTKSAAWLVNANAAAAAAMLLLACFFDLGAVAAQWNVRHGREVGGHGPSIDLCYLDRLGPSALLPLIELEKRPLDPVFRDRVTYLRRERLRELVRAQADWRSWTARGARRLGAARAARPPRPPRPRPGPRALCGGALLPRDAMTASLPDTPDATPPVSAPATRTLTKADRQ